MVEATVSGQRPQSAHGAAKEISLPQASMRKGIANRAVVTEEGHLTSGNRKYEKQNHGFHNRGNIVFSNGGRSGNHADAVAMRVRCESSLH